jgi:signal recognition particle GTPase
LRRPKHSTIEVVAPEEEEGEGEEEEEEEEEEQEQEEQEEQEQEQEQEEQEEEQEQEQEVLITSCSIGNRPDGTLTEVSWYRSLPMSFLVSGPVHEPIVTDKHSPLHSVRNSILNIHTRAEVVREKGR